MMRTIFTLTALALMLCAAFVLGFLVNEWTTDAMVRQGFSPPGAHGERIVADDVRPGP